MLKSRKGISVKNWIKGLKFEKELNIIGLKVSVFFFQLAMWKIQLSSLIIDQKIIMFTVFLAAQA